MCREGENLEESERRDRRSEIRELGSTGKGNSPLLQPILQA